MTSPYKIPREIRIRRPLYLVLGIVLLLIAAVLIFDGAALIEDALRTTKELSDLIYYIILVFLIIFGIFAIYKSLRWSMDNYYLSGFRRCRLTKYCSCKGGCKSCIFALAYLQSEFAKSNMTSDEAFRLNIKDDETKNNEEK